MANLKRIQERIDLIPDLIRQVEELKQVDTKYSQAIPSVSNFNAKAVRNLMEQINMWKEVTSEIVSQEISDSDPYLFTFCEHWRTPIRSASYQAQLVQRLQNAQSDLRILLAVAKEKQERFPRASAKSPKLFISHKTEDKEYADALVSLINYIIGRDEDKIFCSSIAGYGIKPSQDIINEIKCQFDNYNIFMVIIHSPRYYKSPICMNEMGAAWAIDAKFCSFLTKDCRIEQLNGVIGKGEICINPNDEEEMFNSHLNIFKDDLISFFGANPISETKWEHERTKFVKTLGAITIKETGDGGNIYDLFDTVYLQSIDTIFDYLDVDHFGNWAYDCAISGNTILSKSTYEKIESTISYIKSRPKHEKYESWDSLIKNLGQLLSDFMFVYSCHSENFGNDAYYVTRFYKESPRGKSFNPNYAVDLEAYNEHVRLISDLIFEMARLCNLLLTRIRKIHPEYRQELGILHIGSQMSDHDLVYRSEEISDKPYPGIDAYISERLTREKHFGHSGTINIDGYEHNNN